MEATDYLKKKTQGYFELQILVNPFCFSMELRENLFYICERKLGENSHVAGVYLSNQSVNGNGRINFT